MKFGFRTPSFKRSLSAATKGAAKRALMREIVPYYGKRGMGWSNPKKAAYNHLYNMTTASPIDIVLDKPKSSRQSSPQKEITQVDYENKANALTAYKRGLKQCEIPLALMDYIKDDISNINPIHKAIRRLHTYVSGYMNKPLSCGYDYCEMCDERLDNLQRINPNVKEICLYIIHYIRKGLSADDIFAILSKAMPKPFNGLDSLLGTIWVAKFRDKTYALEFELPSVVMFYEVDPKTLNPNTNNSYGLGYSVIDGIIKFRGGVYIGKACNFVSGRLDDSKLCIICSSLSPNREWVDFPIYFTRTTKQVVNLAIYVIAPTIDKISDKKRQTEESYKSEQLELSDTIEPQTKPVEIALTKETADINPQYNSVKTKQVSNANIIKSILMLLGVIAGFSLLIWIIAEFVFPVLLFGLIFFSFLFAKT